MKEQNILDLYSNYIQAFENKNYDFIATVCRTPFFTSSPEGGVVFENREQLLSGFSALRESLDKEGYVGSRINKLEFREIADTTGTLFVDFDRMNPQGEDFHHGQALYLFQGKDESIAIIGILVLDSSTVASWTDNSDSESN